MEEESRQCEICRTTKNYINNRLGKEKSLLIDDDPNGRCAAHHRGVIDALEALLRRFERDVGAYYFGAADEKFRGSRTDPWAEENSGLF